MRIMRTTAAPTDTPPDPYAPLHARAAQGRPRNAYDEMRDDQAARDEARPARTPAARSAEFTAYLAAPPPDSYALALQDTKDTQ